MVTAFALALTAWPLQSRATTMIQSCALYASAVDRAAVPDHDVATDSLTAVPAYLNRTVQAGLSSNTSNYDFGVAGSATVFSFTFDHVRNGGFVPEALTPGDYAASTGDITFTVAEPMTYSVAGSYSLTESSQMSLQVFLYDDTPSSPLFHNMQSGISDSGQVYTVGSQDGKGFNQLISSRTGTLEVGHSYTFHYSYRIASPMPDLGASATGTLSFAVVPEPTTIVFLLLGVVVLTRRTAV